MLQEDLSDTFLSGVEQKTVAGLENVKISFEKTKYSFNFLIFKILMKRAIQGLIEQLF